MSVDLKYELAIQTDISYIGKGNTEDFFKKSIEKILESMRTLNDKFDYMDLEMWSHEEIYPCSKGTYEYDCVLFLYYKSEQDNKEVIINELQEFMSDILKHRSNCEYLFNLQTAEIRKIK